jgi:hypothetical protein
MKSRLPLANPHTAQHVAIAKAANFKRALAPIVETVPLVRQESISMGVQASTPGRAKSALVVNIKTAGVPTNV